MKNPARFNSRFRRVHARKIGMARADGLGVRDHYVFTWRRRAVLSIVCFVLAFVTGCAPEVDAPEEGGEPETYTVQAAESLRSGETKGVHVYCRERTDLIVDAACSVAPNPTRVHLEYEGPNDTLGGEPVGVAWFCIASAPQQPGGPSVSGGRVKVTATCEVGGRPEGYEVQP